MKEFFSSMYNYWFFLWLVTMVFYFLNEQLSRKLIKSYRKRIDLDERRVSTRDEIIDKSDEIIASYVDYVHYLKGVIFSDRNSFEKINHMIETWP